MNRFVCVHRADGAAPGERDLGRYAARVAGPAGTGELNVVAAGPFSAMVWTDTDALRPLVAQRGDWIGVGDVRLDNRAEAASWSRGPLAEAPDLEVVLAALEARGDAAVGALLGDFAFVAWNHRARRLVAARDAFGVKPLFSWRGRGALALASGTTLLAEEGAYDMEFIADCLVGGTGNTERTVWADVRPVGAGTQLSVEDGRSAERRFWSADDFFPADRADEREAVEAFRALFDDAVRLRLADGTPAWAQLSGGLDSSSNVCVAQELAARGAGPSLGGTVTMVDTLGEGDERPYSDAVLARHPLRNETVVDYWAWQDDGREPPLCDEPRPFYPFFARDRRVVDLVREGGGRVILSGLGSDHYLYGNLNYIADLAGRGRVLSAARESAAWAVAHRQSFWKTFMRSAVHPLLPHRLKLSRASAWQRLPQWIDPAFAVRMGVAERLPMMRNLRERPGRLFWRESANEVQSLSGWIDRGVWQEGVEVRYPFLHRPLVEYALRLPPALRIRPRQHKWVLREAMRGTLPEKVRTRTGKGGIDARILWSLAREGDRLTALLRDPVTAQLGCVDPVRLRQGVEDARNGKVTNLAFLLCPLALETWLAVRLGRWVPTPAAGAAAGVA